MLYLLKSLKNPVDLSLAPYLPFETSWVFAHAIQHIESIFPTCQELDFHLIFFTRLPAVVVCLAIK